MLLLVSYYAEGQKGFERRSQKDIKNIEKVDILMVREQDISGSEKKAINEIALINQIIAFHKNN